MKTRAIALLLLALMAALPSAAQSTEQPMYDTSRDPRLVEVNPNFSIGINSLMVNIPSVVPGVSNFMLSPGTLMRAGVNVRFNLNRSLGLGTGLEFGINNVDYSMGIIDHSTGSMTSIFMENHFYDIQAPVYVSMRFAIDRRILWDIAAGIYISRGIGGTSKAQGYTSGENSLGQPIVTHATHDVGYFDNDRPLFNGVSRTDWGPRLSTGLVYKRQWTFNAILQISAPNLAINHGLIDIKYRNLTLAFQLGYIF